MIKNKKYFFVIIAFVVTVGLVFFVYKTGQYYHDDLLEFNDLCPNSILEVRVASCSEAADTFTGKILDDKSILAGLCGLMKNEIGKSEKQGDDYRSIKLVIRTTDNKVFKVQLFKEYTTNKIYIHLIKEKNYYEVFDLTTYDSDNVFDAIVRYVK